MHKGSTTATAVSTSRVRKYYDPMKLYDLASAVIAERVSRNLSPAMLAIELGVPVETIDAVEQGKLPADDRFLRRLAAAVDVTLPDDLVPERIAHR